MGFSGKSQKKRMANVCLEKIDRLELTKIEVAEKIREINETYKRFAMCLSDFNRWKIRSVRYNRDSKNKILVIIVE